jgi:hypothetical protein
MNELRLMILLEKERSAYADEVVAYAQQTQTTDLSPDDVSDLRGPHVELVAQMFLAFRNLEEAGAESYRYFLRERMEHNNRLIADKTIRRRLGKSRHDLESYTMKPSEIDKIVKNFIIENGKVRLNLAQIHKLVSSVVSATTLKDTIDLLERSGFLMRGEFVVSRGILEDMYRRHLQRIISGMSAGITEQQAGPLEERMPA